MNELAHFCHQGPDQAVTAVTRDWPCWGVALECIFTVGQAPGLCATQVPLMDALHCLMVFFQVIKCYLEHGTLVLHKTESTRSSLSSGPIPILQAEGYNGSDSCIYCRSTQYTLWNLKADCDLSSRTKRYRYRHIMCFCKMTEKLFFSYYLNANMTAFCFLIATALRDIIR